MKNICPYCNNIEAFPTTERFFDFSRTCEDGDFWNKMDGTCFISAEARGYLLSLNNAKFKDFENIGFAVFIDYCPKCGRKLKKGTK